MIRFLLWAETESNRRHMDFQSIALPTELSARQKIDVQIYKNSPKPQKQSINFFDDECTFIYFLSRN